MTDSEKLQALRQYIAERTAWLKDFLYHHQCNIPEPTVSEAHDYSEACGELAALGKIGAMIDGQSSVWG